MKISASLLPEFDHEMANTRRTIERVPDDKFGWKPHAKSPSMGWLAAHLAQLPGWASVTLEQDSFDMAPAGEPVRIAEPKTTQAALDLFDQNVRAARSALEAAPDEHLLRPWSLLSGGRSILTMPRVAVLRGFVLNHSIHHRAQLGVYLRLNDLPVPALYGPSADEGSM